MLDDITLAFKYLLGFPNVLPLVGIDKMEHIEEIIRIVEAPWAMSEIEQQEMAHVKAELGTRFCRGCDYCKPCQKEIAISMVLRVRSMVKRYPLSAAFSSGMIGQRVEAVADCIECGECEARCPYYLPIREMIAQNFKFYKAEKRKYQKQV